MHFAKGRPREGSDEAIELEVKRQRKNQRQREWRARQRLAKPPEPKDGWARSIHADEDPDEPGDE